jgi:lysophospholipase L1-like esterase
MQVQGGSRAAINRRPRWRQVVRTLTLSTLLTAGVLYGAEQLARHSGWQAGYFPVPMSWNCLKRSRSLGMEYAPNCVGVSGVEGTKFHTNEFGLRDEPLLDDGATRILSIGDSCTWGWTLAQDKAYPQVLQRLLDEKAARGRYRVINAGRPGYTSYQGMVYLREQGLALDPKIVLIAFGFNDVMPHGDVEESIARQRRAMPVILADDYLLTHSHLWMLLRRYTAGAKPPSVPRAATPEKYQYNLTEMVRLTRAHGATPILVNFWAKPRRPSPYWAALHAVASDLDVPLIEYSGPRLDVIHPTREGATQLARQLLDRLLIDGYVVADGDGKLARSATTLTAARSAGEGDSVPEPERR